MNIKIRKDFDATKEYSVNVSDCTENDKKQVQQAFFDVGILWSNYRATYQYLRAKQYSNKLAIGGVTYHLLYGSTTRGCNMTAKEFLALVYEPEQVGHVHAELIQQYAEDAKTTDKPWKNFQWRTRDSTWLTMQKDMQFESKYEFRRKPKTHIVNGVEVLDLRIKPKCGKGYWLVNPASSLYASRDVYCATGHDLHRAERNLCYEDSEEGRQAAILHSKAMLGIAYLSNAHHTHN